MSAASGAQFTPTVNGPVPSAVKPTRMAQGSGWCRFSPGFGPEHLLLVPAVAGAGQGKFQRFGEARLAGPVATADHHQARRGVQVQTSLTADATEPDDRDSS